MGVGRVSGFAGAVGLSAVAAGVYATVGRRWLRQWGATEAEVRSALPGDGLLARAVYQTMHAIDVEATPDEVWPWLVQMGQGRGGFYSYDWVEKLAGLDIHSTHRLIPEYQRLAEGDIVRLAPNTGLVAAVVQPPRALVLRAVADLESKRAPVPSDPGYFDWSWAFVIEPAGDRRSRLLIRLRADTVQRFPFSLVGPLVWEPLHFLMERKMLRGIRERAERGAGVGDEAAREGERVTTEEARRRSGAGGLEPGGAVVCRGDRNDGFGRRRAGRSGEGKGRRVGQLVGAGHRCLTGSSRQCRLLHQGQARRPAPTNRSEVIGVLGIRSGRRDGDGKGQEAGGGERAHRRPSAGSVGGRRRRRGGGRVVRFVYCAIRRYGRREKDSSGGTEREASGRVLATGAIAAGIGGAVAGSGTAGHTAAAVDPWGICQAG